MLDGVGRFEPGRGHWSLRARVGVRPQRGETLIETMITVAMVGLLFLTLMVGVTTAVGSSTTTYNAVRTRNEASVVAEAINRARYQPCAGVATYGSVLPAAAAIGGLVASIKSVTYLESRTTTLANYVSTPCTADQGSQRITVLVKSKDLRMNLELVFTKRDDRCPTSIVTVPGETC